MPGTEGLGVRDPGAVTPRVGVSRAASIHSTIPHGRPTPAHASGRARTSPRDDAGRGRPPHARCAGCPLLATCAVRFKEIVARENGSAIRAQLAGTAPKQPPVVVVSERPAEVAIEVKVQRVGVGDILRQMKLYQEYTGFPHAGPAHWFAVTAYSLSEPEMRALKEAGIRHLRLGARFQEWAQRQSRASVPAADEEI